MDKQQLIKEVTPTATEVTNIVSVVDLRSVICNILNISEECSDKELMTASLDFKEKFYGKNTNDEGIGTDKQSDSVVK